MSNEFTAKPPPSKRRKLIASVTNEAANYLCLDLDHDTSNRVVQVVDETIVSIVFERPIDIPNEEEKDLLLGCLWGAQMVREFDWTWSDIFFEEGMDVAVLSPSKDMVIFPFTFVNDCIQKRSICTIELSFNMLKERRNETVFERGSLENVMAHIRHIVPPYDLDPKT